MTSDLENKNNTSVGKRPRGRPKASVTKNSKTLAPEFIELCKQGLSLVQIADKLNIGKDTLERWSRDKVRHKDFSKAFEQGKTAWQAYHETLLQDMISGKSGKKYASAEISAQQFVLKTQFKSEWTEKTDTKIEVNHINQLTNDQLEQQILMLLGKTNIQNYINENSTEQLRLVVNNDAK
jgi:hypothetical protein